MADLKISDLPTDIVALADGDKFPVADASALTANTYATALEIKTYANSDTYLRIISTDHALTSTTAIQAMFPSPSSLTLAAGKYEFYGMLIASGMSATSGNMKFQLDGTGSTAVIDPGDVYVNAIGIDGTGGAATQTGTWTLGTSTPGNMVSAATTTSMRAGVFGRFTISSAGVIVPSIALANASSASFFAGTFLCIKKVANTGVNAVGPWS